MSYQPRRMKNDDDDPYKKMRRKYEEESRSYSVPRKNNYGGYNTKTKQKSKKSNGKLGVIFKILALVYVIITIIFYVSILRLNLLPSSYVTMFTIAEIVFTLLIGIGLAKTHKTKKLNIFCLIIALLVSGVYMYITNYANATTDFLGTMFQEVQETDEYYVVVRKDSNYDSIDDIDGEDVYTFQIEEDVQAELSNEVDVN